MILATRTVMHFIQQCQLQCQHYRQSHSLHLYFSLSVETHHQTIYSDREDIILFF